MKLLIYTALAVSIALNILLIMLIHSKDRSCEGLAKKTSTPNPAHNNNDDLLKIEIEVFLNYFKYLKFLNGEEVVRSRRQASAPQSQGVVNQITTILIDSVVNSLKSNMGDQSVVLMDAIKPTLISFATGTLNEFVETVKNMIKERSLLNFNFLASSAKESAYGVYPVFIPEYGSFILMSDSNQLERMSSKMIRQSREDSSSNNQEIDSNSTSTESSSTAATTSDETTSNTTEVINDTTKKTQEIKKDNDDFYGQNDFRLSEAYLIPIVDEPNVFENSRSANLVGLVRDGALKEYIRRIVESKRSTIKSAKKRVLLFLLRKLEGAVRKL